jgi:uncharacterized protein YbbC (DUF1343 family)
MILGIDHLLENETLLGQLRGRKVALLANQASMNASFDHALDALAPVVQLTAAFGPQHGLRGEKQDNMQETADTVDAVHNIPVYSLYSENRKPTAPMMKNFDVVLVDLQDVGTRIYTFLTTLFYMIEACAEHKKEIWILDRPNPAGRRTEGMRLEKGWVSFVGAAEGLSMRHGMTLGEIARWFVARNKIDVQLKVVEMKNYNPAENPWPSTLPWVNPSPNASNLSMVRCFPGTVLVEGTHLSEGRGTTRPLEIVGHPEINPKDLLKSMEVFAPHWMQGCVLRPCYFLPTFQKHAGQICGGLQIHVEGQHYNEESFTSYRLMALMLNRIRNLYPQIDLYRNFHYEYEKDRLAFDLINGGPDLRLWIEKPNASTLDLDARLYRDDFEWEKDRAEFLIY